MLKRSLKRRVPVRWHASVREAYLSLRRLPNLGGVYLHPWRRQSLARLSALRGSQQGRRAFIIGNGPSLRHTDLSLLRDEFTFGLNRIYLMFPALGFRTSCLVSVNDLVVEQCAHEFQALDMPRFFSWRSRRFMPTELKGSDVPTFLYTTYESSWVCSRCPRPPMGRRHGDVCRAAARIPHGIPTGLFGGRGSPIRHPG